MKTLLRIFMFISTIHAFQSEKEIKIGTHTFTLVKKSYNEYGDRGVTMALYTKNENNKKLKKLRFLLKNESGACSDKDMETGVYVIEKDSITFYTQWKRARNSTNTPSGNRMQVYKVDENASFYMSHSALYVETSSRNRNADEGMKYLYVEAKTKNEKKLLAEYIEDVEHTFKAKFVMGDKAKALAAKVNEALEDKVFQ